MMHKSRFMFGQPRETEETDDKAERARAKKRMAGPGEPKQETQDNKTPDNKFDKKAGQPPPPKYDESDKEPEGENETEGHGIAIPEDQLPPELRGLKGGERVTLKIEAVASPVSVSVGGGPKLASFMVRRVTTE